MSTLTNPGGRVRKKARALQRHCIDLQPRLLLAAHAALVIAGTWRLPLLIAI